MACLESALLLKSIFMFENWAFTMFVHVVQTTPMLQAQVIGEVEQSTMFSRLDQDKSPVLRVHHVEGDDRVHPTARQLNHDALEALLSEPKYHCAHPFQFILPLLSCSKALLFVVARLVSAYLF
jgi:hypothetical protein